MNDNETLETTKILSLDTLRPDKMFCLYLVLGFMCIGTICNKFHIGDNSGNAILALFMFASMPFALCATVMTYTLLLIPFFFLLEVFV